MSIKKSRIPIRIAPITALSHEDNVRPILKISWKFIRPFHVMLLTNKQTNQDENITFTTQRS